MMNKTADGYDLITALFLGALVLIELKPITNNTDPLTLLVSGLVIVLLTASICQWVYNRKF